METGPEPKHMLESADKDTETFIIIISYTFWVKWSHGIYLQKIQIQLPEAKIIISKMKSTLDGIKRWNKTVQENIGEAEDTVVDTIENINTESKRLEKMERAAVSYESPKDGVGTERKNYLRKRVDEKFTNLIKTKPRDPRRSTNPKSKEK